MYRFRKKSDTKHSQSTNTALLPAFNQNDRHSSTSSTTTSDVLLPEVPTSDFRSSLILPDLSRRFSLLKNSTGDQLSWEDLKSKFADQRARGAQHQISEEEEDMLLDTLGRIRPLSNPEKADLDSSIDSPSKSFASRRYNNLFGASNRFRDNNYIRSVTSQRSTQSISTTKTTSSLTESLRPVTPEDSITAPSMQSTPNSSKAPSEQPSPLSSAEYRLSKALGPNGIKRASLALQQAIKEIEEEVEEEIVMPRRPASRMTETKDANGTVTPSSTYETGTAISAVSDHREDSQRASPVPTQITSSYTPGMPRPITPHMSVEVEEQRSHSTTPRATSPSSLHFRRDSESQSRSPLNSSFFIARSANGRFTPDASIRDTYASDNDTSHDSSIQARRRPVSPLSGGSFQPLSIGSSSRPSTPSNVTWNPNPASANKHTRDASWTSDGGTMESSDIHRAAGVEQSKSSVRSFRSALPDSPFLEGMDSEAPSRVISMDARPISPLSPDDMGMGPPPPLSRLLRSPTPTQDQRPLTSSPGFNLQSSPERKRHSRHNSTSPAYNFGSLNTLPFSPIVNSSRSSLESEGSSYHSWEGDHAHNRPPSIFDHVDHQQPWHALSTSDKSSTSATSTDDLTHAEEILKQYAGLTKEDIGTIQTKLVTDATNKLSTARERTSSLRKRRPSTSQGSYPNLTRVASPPPPNASSQETVPTVQPVTLPPAPAPAPVVAAPPVEMTPSQRTRELAKALFGSEDEGADPTRTPDSLDTQEPVVEPVEPIEHVEPVEPIVIPNEPPSREPSDPPSSEPSPAFTPQITPQQPKIEPTNILEDMAARARLTLEVQRRTTEATAKYGSSHARRKVAIHEISSPTMVASSTSVNTIPIPYAPSPVQRTTPSASPIPSSPLVTSTSGSKFGSRIKRLRGTLRSKQAPTGEEVTPYPFNSPAPIQTAIDPAKLQSSASLVGPMSAVEARRQKEVVVPNPPASAGPGFRGFMARLRGRQRGESTSTQASRVSPLPTPTGSISSHSQLASSFSEQQAASRRLHQTQQPPSPLARSIAEETASPPLSMISQTMVEAPESKTVSALGDEQTVQKFVEAAARLGFDQESINDLLARKASTSSRGTSTLTGLTRNNTITSTTIPEHVPERPESQPSVALELPPPSPTAQKQSVRKSTTMRRIKEGDSTGPNAVVRRTLIFPSDSRASMAEFGTLVNNALGKKASSRRKRSSVQSNRSVQERVPTPPPRSSTSKRFSTEPSPPVPHLPQAFAASSGDPNLLQVPRATAVDSGSTYDSFYEMYSGEHKSDPGGPDARDGDLGPALEVVELANGETIWQIINGLRDDDAESQYRRTSFDSEYSTADGMQVFFKERRGSKGSVASFVSRKKAAAPRPETKVFYSSTAQIGKLIENLSSGLEAGSFNFHPASHIKPAATNGN